MTQEKKHQVTILGEEIVIHFCMAVEIAYEEITGEPFNIESLNSQKNSIALYMAAILTAKPDTEITVDRLLKEASGQEIVNVATAVINSMTEWMKMPAIIPDDEPQPEEEEDAEGDKQKN